MSRYEKLLNMVMDFNNSVRLAVISNTEGEILWNAKRKDVSLKIPLAETKKALRREASDWVERCKLEDRSNIGRAMYNICLLYTSPSPRDKRQSRMPSSA